MVRSDKKRSSLLRNLDLFGYTPSLLYGGEGTFTSKYGGALTIGISALYALIATFTIWRYFQRDSPSTNINKLYVKDPVGFNLTQETLPIAFGLQDPSTYSQYIDPSIYTVEANYVRYKKRTIDGKVTVDRKEHPIPLTTCDKVGLDPKFFQNLELSQMFCFESFKPEGLDIEITGVFESNDYGLIEIYVNRCQGPNCQDINTINEKVQGGYFAANFINRETKTSDYERPIEEYPSSFFTPVSTYYRKENILFLADNELYTDSPIIGYLPPSGQYYPNIASLRTDIADLSVDKDSPRQTFYNLNLRMDHIKTITQRNYSTVYDFLAEFGGLAQIITFIGFFLTYRTKYVELHVDLVKKFSVQEENYQTLLKLHRQLGRTKTKMPNHQNPKADNILSAKMNTYRSMLISDRRHEETEENPKDLNPEIAEEGNEPKVVAGAVFGRGSMIDNSKIFNSLNKKSSSQKYSNTESISDFQKNLNQKTELEVLQKIQPSPQTEENPEPSIESIENTEEVKLDTRANLVGQIVESMKKIGSDRRRYESLLSTLKSVSGWKAYLYSWFPCFMKKSTIASIVDLAEHDLYKKFDFVQILHFMEEFKKLKRMLLTADQQILFNMVPGDKLAFKEDEDTENKFSYKNHLDSMKGKEVSMEETTREDILGAFDRIWNQRVHSEMDTNLLISLGFFYYGDKQRNSFANRFGFRPSIAL